MKKGSFTKFYISVSKCISICFHPIHDNRGLNTQFYLQDKSKVFIDQEKRTLFYFLGKPSKYILYIVFLFPLETNTLCSRLFHQLLKRYDLIYFSFVLFMCFAITHFESSFFCYMFHRKT